MLKLKLTVVVIFVYMSSKLEYINSKGRQKTKAFARVKDVNAVIQEIIRGRGLRRPLGPLSKEICIVLAFDEILFTINTRIIATFNG